MRNSIGLISSLLSFVSTTTSSSKLPSSSRVKVYTLFYRPGGWRGCGEGGEGRPHWHGRPRGGRHGLAPGLDRGLHDVRHHLLARPALREHGGLGWCGLQGDPEVIQIIMLTLLVAVASVTIYFMGVGLHLYIL